MREKRTSRLLLRLLLVASAVGALGVVVAALARSSWFSETGVVVAAALAVLAALLSGWTSLRVLELQEDSLEPQIRAELDSRRRYQLTQFRLRNVGGSTAKNIGLEWDEPLTTVDGEIIEVGQHGTAYSLPVLSPGDEFSILLGASHRFYADGRSTDASGWIKFENASGEPRRERFVLSGEHERRAMVHNEEEPKTLYELQKIPEKLDALALELSKLRQQLTSGSSDGQP